MQSYTYRKNPFNEIVCSQPAFIFDNSLKFSTSYGIFHSYPNACNFFVIVFLFFGKLLSLSFLNRLYDCHLFRSISLISCILTQGTGKEYIVSAVFLSCVLPQTVSLTKMINQDIVMITTFCTV